MTSVGTVLRLSGKWLLGISGFLVVSVACGILTSGLLLPVVVVGSAVANTGKAVVEAIDDELEMPQLSQKSYLLASDGTLLTTFYAQNRVAISLDQVSQAMQDAVVALEDRRFWEHSGVDVLGMARAFLNNAASGAEATQGASTLTQQLVKNLLIDQAVLAGDEDAAAAASDKSYARKLREAKMAVALEKKYGKQKVLEAYLNIAQFGPSVYGVEAAATYYFGVHASELSVVQAATIAAVTQKPNGMDPVNNPKSNKTRRDAALAAMLRDGYITQGQYTQAVATDVTESLNLTPSRRGCEVVDETVHAGFFCDYVVAEIRNSEAFGKDARERKELLDRGGLTITTTLDIKTQQAAWDAVNGQVPYDDESGVGHALTAVEPGTGRIIAMAQNRLYMSGTTDDPYYTSVNYNADRAYGGSSGFQVGSTFKPFILAAWLEADHSLLEVFDGSRQSYRPAHFPASCLPGGHTMDGNWDIRGGASASVNAYTATAASMNAAYAAMEYALDMCAIGDLLSRVGVHRADGSEWPLNASMVLGSGEISPLTMASSYATFASGGAYCSPTSIDAVIKPDGSVLELPERDCVKAVEKGVADGVNAALERVVSSGTGNQARLSGGRTVAGKTGTTNNNVAAWFCGYTPQLAAAVWTGYPDQSKSLSGKIGNSWYTAGAFGGGIAAPTFAEFMNVALDGAEKLTFDSPPSVIERGRMRPIPDVVGLTEKDATEKLRDAGFASATNDGAYSDTVPEGAVVEQSPRGAAYPGTKITMTLSRGPEPPPVEPEPPIQPVPPPVDPPADTGQP
ncbi:MAG: transglycosylase domain-containing protein [Bifidobacteriaceae bacterium]|nr:transglycosylase domain-containing protein [Bifidobacteriaceae bacterium]